MQGSLVTCSVTQLLNDRARTQRVDSRVWVPARTHSAHTFFFFFSYSSSNILIFLFLAAFFLRLIFSITTFIKIVLRKAKETMKKPLNPKRPKVNKTKTKSYNHPQSYCCYNFMSFKFACLYTILKAYNFHLGLCQVFPPNMFFLDITLMTQLVGIFLNDSYTIKLTELISYCWTLRLVLTFHHHKPHVFIYTISTYI